MSAAAGLDFRRVAAARASTSCARGSAANSWPNLARFAYCRGVRNWLPTPKKGKRPQGPFAQHPWQQSQHRPLLDLCGASGTLYVFVRRVTFFLCWQLFLVSLFAESY